MCVYVCVCVFVCKCVENQINMFHCQSSIFKMEMNLLPNPQNHNLFLLIVDCFISINSAEKAVN